MFWSCWYRLGMFLLFSLVIKQGVLLANKIFLGYKSSSIIKGCWGEMLAKLIFSRTHSKCWSDGNAARTFTSFCSPWRPHAGPSLEENTDNAAGFSQAHKQQNAWIFWVLSLQPPMQSSLHSPEAAIPYHLHQGILLWSLQMRLRSGKTELAQQQWDICHFFCSSLKGLSHLFEILAFLLSFSGFSL